MDPNSSIFGGALKGATIGAFSGSVYGLGRRANTITRPFGF
jgi:hypothetical protein